MLRKEKIKFVGFDLDQTLYKDTEEIQKCYRDTIYKDLSKELKLSYEEAEERFEKNYKIFGSGSDTFRFLGIDKAEQFSANISNKVEVYKFLRPDLELVNMVRYLKEKYTIFLITTSAKESSYRKLKKIGFDPESDFEFRIFGGDRKMSKTKGRAYNAMLKLTKGKPIEHVYVGDKEKADIIPAKRVGMQTVIVWNKSKHADLNISTIYDLEKYL
ncbi:MAG: HAD hydrolase-like protein [Candidatus Moranbacteria bacterium]|nr:HAD hydrolase-like protein [Candidatus Moranbacteria bacterium]